MSRRELWQCRPTVEVADATAVRRAWLQLLAVVTVLIGLAALLPGPVQLIGELVGRRTTGSGGTAVADHAMLLLCAAAVWLLLIWAILVAAAAWLGRLPGAAGRLARNILRRIA